MRMTMVVDPIEKAFKDGSISDENMWKLYRRCGSDPDAYASLINGLGKLMDMNAVNAAAEKLCRIDAQKNPDRFLRENNLARAFAAFQFERLLGNRKDAFVEKVTESIKNSGGAKTLTVDLTFDDLKNLLPALLSTPNKAVTSEEQKKNFAEVISFNIVKPFVLSKIKDPEINLKTVRTQFKLDDTVATQLFEEYNRLKAEKGHQPQQLNLIDKVDYGQEKMQKQHIQPKR